VGVHAEIQNPHPDSLALQSLKNSHQILDRAGKPIQFGDHEYVAFSSELQGSL